MSSGIRRHERLNRLADMQMLKALASASDYSAALAECQHARAALETCDANVQAQAVQIDAAMAGGAFDFERWRIGRAVLDALSAARDAAAEGAEMAAKRECSSRQEWHCEQQRERRLGEQCRAGAKRLEEKRDQAAMSEIVGLRQGSGGIHS